MRPRWWKRQPYQRFDAWGMPYDFVYKDRDGFLHYRMKTAMGRSLGPAVWTQLESHNKICGHHLGFLCTWCGHCVTCDWCRCKGRLAA